MSEYPPSPYPDWFRRRITNLVQIFAFSGKPARQIAYLAIFVSGFAAAIDAVSFSFLAHVLNGTALAAGTVNAAGAVAFLLASIFATLVRLFGQRLSIRAQTEVTRSIAVAAFLRLQGQTYSEYLDLGASEGFTVFERLQMVSYFGLTALVGGLSAAAGVTVMLIGLGLIYPWWALTIATGIGGFLAISAALFSGRRPVSMSSLARERTHLLYEARNGFRAIALANAQERIAQDFSRAETAYRLEQAHTQLASQSSRFAIELSGLGAALLILVGLIVWPKLAPALFPALGIVAIVGLRILPLVSNLRSATKMISLHAEVTEDILALLQKPDLRLSSAKGQPILFENSITLRHITLRRKDRPIVLNSLNLDIARGARIGIRGPSGSGKSSLLDIVCGLLQPDAGEMAVDGRHIDHTNASQWRERIGVVSQNPVLLGADLREAIAYPDLPQCTDQERLDFAARAAGLDAMAAQFPRGFDTPLGELASHLSGGQRQRLALAHAIYHARDLLILDEATGQLDPDTEAEITAAIAGLPPDLTIIVSSHRAAPLALCDRVYTLSGGRLT